MLWAQLRRRQVRGFKFRRQAPIGPFVADFACLSAKLIIEIDGPSHDFKQPYDAARTAWFKAHGFRVFRVTADDVLRYLDGVVEAIEQELTEGSPPPPCGRDLPA